MRVVYKKYNLVESGGTGYEIKERSDSGVAFNSYATSYGSYSFDRNTGMFTLEEKLDGYTKSDILQSNSGAVTNIFYVFKTIDGSEPKQIMTVYSEKAGVSYSQGSYVGEVIAEDGYYPRNGRQNGYWYVWDRYANTAPTLSGSYTNIGFVNKDFDISYIVKDADNDDVKVEIRVDNQVIQHPMYIPLDSTQTVRINIDNYGLGEHTITITATDSSNASSTRKYYFTKSNTAPTISGSHTYLGIVKQDFDITYMVQDSDGDDVNVEIRVDNKIIQYPMWTPSNSTQKLRIKLNEYNLGDHTITITATDSSNASSTRTYYFTKSNKAPTISGSDINMGSVYKDFSIDYIVQDSDGDDVKVSILSDGYVKQSPTYTSLGIRKYYTVKMSEYNLGKHTLEIIAEDSFGAKSTRTISFEKVNSAPIISGRDENLGAKNTSFSYSYSVSDNEKDSVRVVERLNGKTIRTLTNASLNTKFSINITSEQIKKLDINRVNTIEIEASDGNATTFRRVTFSRNNMPPIISGKDVELGEKDKSLNYSYSATDPERDKIFATVYLDDKVLIARKSIVDGASQNIKIDGLEFLKISKGNHRIEIVVEDDKGFKSTRTVRFTRTIARLVMELGNKGIDTGSTLAKRVLVSTVGIYVAKGAIAKYEVCNNAFDSNPTWEDATTMVNAGKAFNFQNKSKTAAKAGINIRVSIEKGDSMMASYISSIGGSFD